MRNAAEALEALAARTGLDDLAFDDEGACSLVVGEDIEIFLIGDADADFLQITGIVGDLQDPSLARRLLELNAANHNGPVAFGVDQLTDEIVLSRHLPIGDMSPEALLAAVEDFIDRVEFWTDYLPRMERTDETVGDLLPETDVVMLRG
jgi:hypothetical protein